ncbi:SCY1-like protein 2 [Parelaphostrongylus tenuis]|uniref:SCY1-like protein 2 n=1 Tax=Parelaphostrongylus tenuis TaxID=148309 RepID=A0AAD5QS67_PARTN|nr:SCY1-like protein 2 [Parelaphostrongylus tenuis]
MEYFNKFRATVTQVAAQVTNALPGNPLLREYEIGDQTCAAGPGFYWKVFRGVKKSTKKQAKICNGTNIALPTSFKRESSYPILCISCDVVRNLDYIGDFEHL